MGGDLHVSPRPASLHARAAAAFDRALGLPFDEGRDGPGGWWILFEPELHLGDDILVPDLAGWRRRWTVLGTFEGSAMVRADPFAAVEIELRRLWPEG